MYEDGQSPWCVLDSHTMNLKQCTCGECDASLSVEHIHNKLYSDDDLNALVVYGTHPSTEPYMLADSVYLFVNKCIRQRTKIPTDTSNTITARMAETLHEFPTLTTSYWITKVLLDLYEQDQHILDSPKVHKCIAHLLNVTASVMSDAQLRLEDATVIMNAISALVTLVSGLFCYGLPDHEAVALELPVEVERPDDAQNLECVFEDPSFCSGLVRILVYGTTMFDKWFGRDSLFHWDLAIIALVTKNRVLHVPALRDVFVPKVIEALFEVSADYSSLIIIAKTRPLPWKRLVLECISIVLTGSNSYLLGIALVDQTSGTRRFGVFLSALLKHYGTIEKIREACMQSNCSPPPVARAVGMLMSLSGRDHNHISRMMRRLRHHVDTPGVIAADPNPPSPHPEPDVPKETKLKVSDLERDRVFQQLIQEEESHKRVSVASSIASTKKKKKVKRGNNSKNATASDEKSDAESDDIEDDPDAYIYHRLGIKRPVEEVIVVKNEKELLPFGSPAKKRTNKKRRQIQPLRPIPHEPKPSPQIIEPVPAVPDEPKPSPQIIEPVPAVPDEFSYTHEWAHPFTSGHLPLFPDRDVTHFWDVLRWTPLVYAYSALRSFEKQVDVQPVI